MKPVWLVPGVAAMLALGLRLWNNGFGLPDTFGADEPKMVNHALAFGLGDLNPHYFVYPALQMYLLFGVYGLLFVFLWGTGAVQSLDHYKLLFLTDPTPFYRTGRALTALFGAACVLLVARLGVELFGSPAAGWLAALALALHPLDVLHGHYITADVPMTFFLLLSLLFSARLAANPNGPLHALGGAACGLALATKYSALVALLPLGVAHLIGARRLGRRALPGRLLLGLSCLALSFFLASPFSVFEWRETLAGMRFILDVKRQGQFGVARGASWPGYLQILFLSSPLALASLAGLLHALRRRTPGDLLVLSLVIPYFLTVGGSQSQSPRYLVPLLPLLLLLAARLACELWRASGTRVARLALAAGVGLALAFSAGETLALGRELGLRDTRTVAREWIEANVRAGATVAVEWGGDDTVRLREDLVGLAGKRRRYEGGEGASHNAPSQMATALRLLERVDDGRRRYRLVVMGENENNVLRARHQDLQELRRLGVDYVVTSSAALGDPSSEAFRRAYPAIAAFYAELDGAAAEVARFEATPGRLRGPRIVVYRLRAEVPAAATEVSPPGAPADRAR